MNWTLAAVVVSLGALVACSSSKSGTSGGGGEGGEEWNGGNGGGKTTSNASSGTGGTGGMGGSGGAGGGMAGSGGGSSCDGSGTCQACQQCAQANCQAEIMACQTNMACAGLTQCLSTCMPSDSTCIQNCAGMYQAGIQPYNAVAVCLICDNCKGDCAQQAGMCPP